MGQHGNAFGDSQAQNIQIAADQGSGPGKLQEWTIDFGTLLTEYELPDPCAPTVVPDSKILVFNPITPVAAVASGTSASYRLLDSDNNVIYQGNNDIGILGSNKPVIKTSLIVVSGAIQTVVSFRIGYS
ncbi:hypothetical protein [Phormidium tenue]|uniref:Uncharacterized protein n=1 Tax=Phormidium tenue FACHB-1050 TaxID=2692857 RepID=A0ABR8C7I3_9CYAN|nr:hypothetical protein [Phormidium tenue]MBD2316688.1 hypothetical protein [Phormidium tenue FACHB-1050]